MKILLAIILLSLLLTGLSIPDAATGSLFLFWRGIAVQWTGLLAIMLMTCLLVLAWHPRWLEQRLGGLDKLYKLHKTLGISTGVTAILHWLMTKLPKIAVAMQWVELGGRRPHGTDPWRGLMTEFGEIAFYAMVAFVIFSLIRKIPYRYFRFVHRLGAVIALLALLHGVYMISDAMRWTVFGWSSMILCAISAVAVLMSLFGLIGRSSRYRANLIQARTLSSSILELTLLMPDKFSGRYQPGQFVFLTLDRSEGKHPFTVSSYDEDKHELILTIKALGDYTQQLIQSVGRMQKTAIIEGPYGQFQLPDADPSIPQYWVAGGVGITPFMAWLHALSQSGEQRQHTVLVYCVHSAKELIRPDWIRAQAKAAGIEVQFHISEESGRWMPQQNVDVQGKVWFCGPTGLRRQLSRIVPAQNLHYEFFEFR